MSDRDYWADRLADSLTAAQLHAQAARDHAAAGRVWDAVHDTAAALAAATIASETARQWRRAHHPGGVQ